MLMTTSMPLSCPSHLKLHMPSFALFQYAPMDEFMPVFDVSPPAPAPLPGADPLKRCWMIVLLTANL
jgi:hypothetical protein